MPFDPYNRTGELSPAAVTAMAERLESRSRDPAFVGMLDDYPTSSRPCTEEVWTEAVVSIRKNGARRRMHAYRWVCSDRV